MDKLRENIKLKEYIKNIFNKDEKENIIREDDLCDDQNRKNKLGNLVIYLRYIYWYVKNNQIEKNNSIELIEKLNKLKYFLINLGYNEWKEINYEITELFSNAIAKKEDIYEYFLNKKYEEIIEENKIEKINGVNDIKVRIRELCVKTKVIDYVAQNRERFKELNIETKIDYRFFEELERRSSQRSIYYLLYISGLWELKISDEKINKLLRYKNVSEKYFKNKENDYEWRKIFSMVVYYNEEEKKLLCSDYINKNSKLSFWKDELYFIEDDMHIEMKELRQKKLEKVKLAYNLYIDDIISQLKLMLAEKNYDNCWLKYALSSKYYNEKILMSDIKYNNGIVEINRNKYNSYINFFAYIYILNKKRENSKVNVNIFESGVYNLQTLNVRDTLYWDEYTVYSDRIENNIINMNKLELLWQRENEKYLNNRCFFYSKHIVTIYGDSNTLISLENDKIVKRVFYLNDYQEYYHNFDQYKNNIGKKRKEEDETISNIGSLYNKYLEVKETNQSKINLLEKNMNNQNVSLEIKKLQDEIKSTQDKVYKLINEKYICEKSYKNGTIRKYLYKDAVKENILQTQFIKSKSEVV